MADQADAQPSAEESSVDDGSASATVPNSGTTTSKPEQDPELDELLNNALKDFDKVKVSEGAESSAQAAKGEEGAAGGKPAMKDLDGLPEEFSEVFSEQFAAQVEESMSSFMSQNPSVMQQFEKLVQAADTAGDSQEAQQNFMETLTQTLVDMTQNAEGIQSETLEEQESEGQGAEGQGEDFMPMMQEMMQTLLSKSVLYPSLKEISSKYPAYLAENQGKVEAEVLDSYQKQYDLMTSICSVYEEEQPDDSPQVKSDRFEKLLDLMQQMQELGQPPKDIVGDMAPGLEFDGNGMPKLPGMGGQQCRLM